MSDTLFIIVVGTNILVVLLAVVILLRNTRLKLIQYLSAFLIALSLWTLSANLLGESLTLDENLVLTKAAFAAMVAASVLLVWFSRELIERPLRTTSKTISGLIGGVMIWFIFQNFVMDGVHMSATGFVIPHRTSGYLIFLMIILSMFLYALGVIFTYWRHHAVGLQKRQTGVILFGLLLGTVAGVTTNVVLPNLLGSTAPSRFSIIATIIWAATLIYAVGKHKFLDIRQAAVRSIAYIASLMTLVGLYYICAYLVSATLLKGTQEAQGIANSYNMWLALSLTLVFQPIKHFFDKLTDAIFFRNDYNSQEVLDKLGKIIVQKAPLASLTRESLALIMTYMKPAFTQLIIRDESDDMNYLRSSGQGGVPKDELIRVLSAQHQLPAQIIAISQMKQDDSWRQLMQAIHAEVLVGLTTANNARGYLILGEKRSGVVYRQKDIDLVSVIADELAVAIENSLRYEEIQSFNTTLQEKVEGATSELKASNRKLHELDKTKDEFISMASHQLRTPLTTVKGYISMLLEGDAGEVTPQQRKLLEEAFNSSQRMVYLIGDFLNVSRIQTGKFELEKSPCNLADILNEEIEQLQIAAKARQVSLQYDKPSQFPELVLDENKIRQVMMNFIDNAIYYSRAGGKAHVILSCSKNAIEFKVIDQGIGVPTAQRPHLFTKFFRADNAKKQRPDGTGIGLFMAKKAVIAHGGSIIFESKEGKGSTFGFRLPRARNI